MDGDSIDRVFTSEETRLYRTKVVLAHNLPALPGIAPVYSTVGEVIGYALVVPEGSRVLAELTIDYACEERLLAETKASKVYAYFVGVPTGDKTRIQMIRLSLQRPDEGSRLSPLGEPVL